MICVIFKNKNKNKNKIYFLEYFPTKEAATPEEIEKNVEKFVKNEWQVINCHINELATELRKLGGGRKQLDIARWQDQATVVVNHLEDF